MNRRTPNEKHRHGVAGYSEESATEWRATLKTPQDEASTDGNRLLRRDAESDGGRAPPPRGRGGVPRRRGLVVRPRRHRALPPGARPRLPALHLGLARPAPARLRRRA